MSPTAGDATTPEPGDTASREPGDRPPASRPAGRLARPPSERYATPAIGGPSTRGGAQTTGPATMLGALTAAIGASIVMAAALLVVGGVLAGQQGLLAIAGVGGAAIGLLAARATVSRDGVAPPILGRGRATRAAVALALLAVVGAALGTWAYSRLEGGVLDPLTYLWSVFGPFVPAEAAIAAVAAAWGAGAGPIRSGS